MSSKVFSTYFTIIDKTNKMFESFSTYLTTMNTMSVTIFQLLSLISQSLGIVRLKNTGKIKTKKCQPAASDTPDLIKTERVTDSGLARPNKKINKMKNSNKMKHEKPGWKSLFEKWNKLKFLPEKCYKQNEKCYNKNKKVSACCRRHTRSNQN